MRRTVVVFLALALLFTLPYTVTAKKKLGQKVTTGRSTGVAISPRLRGDRKALVVYFSGLSQANSVSYTLSYEANSLPQGVGGTITPSQNTAQRELLFGTCSKNVCTYHRNITDMRFTVTSNLKSGKKVTKPFRIKP